MKFILRHLNNDSKILYFNKNFYATFRPNLSKSMSYLNISEPGSHLATDRNAKKKKQRNPQEYTTYSHFNHISSISKGAPIKEEAVKQVEENTVKYLPKVEKMMKYLYVPVICLPMGLHFCYTLYDISIVGKLTHYSLQNFLKHSFLVSCINTGILSGFKLNEERNLKEITTRDIMISYMYLFTSFAAVNAIAFYPMGYLAFNSVYLLLIFSNLNISKSLDIIIPCYSKFIYKFFLFTMGAMLIFTNLYYKDYNKKVSEQGKFEDVVKFYELSSDREFKKVMTSMQELLFEIDVKVEKSKE